MESNFTTSGNREELLSSLSYKAKDNNREGTRVQAICADCPVSLEKGLMWGYYCTRGSAAEMMDQKTCIWFEPETDVELKIRASCFLSPVCCQP